MTECQKSSYDKYKISHRLLTYVTQYKDKKQKKKNGSCGGGVGSDVQPGEPHPTLVGHFHLLVSWIAWVWD